jgi:hypothetical protein
MVNMKHDRRDGMALMAVVVGTFTAISALAVLMTLASFSSETSDTERRVAEARYLAFGALEQARFDLVHAVANWDPVPTKGEAQIGDYTVGYEISESGIDLIETDSAGI